MRISDLFSDEELNYFINQVKTPGSIARVNLEKFLEDKLISRGVTDEILLREVVVQALKVGPLSSLIKGDFTSFEQALAIANFRPS